MNDSVLKALQIFNSSFSIKTKRRYTGSTRNNNTTH